MPPFLRARYERLARHLTQAQLATLTGLHSSEVSLIENGRLVPSPQQLDKLAKVFGITPASVLLKPVSIKDDPEEEVEAEDRPVEQTA